MKFTYRVCKVVKTEEGSDVDGKYFIMGNLDYDNAVYLAENLQVIDIQMSELIMCDIQITYRVYNEQTGKIKKSFRV